LVKAGEIDADTLGRRSADAVHEYLQECLLGDMSLGEGALCALDLDGVLETDRLGYPASGPGGVLALRALVAHGYRPVLATGRSLVDARDRCTTFGLAGAVAEYGTVVYDHVHRTSLDLRTGPERDLIDRVRESLIMRGVDVVPGYRYTVRVRANGGPLAHDLVEATPILQDPRLLVVHGQAQSDVTVRRLDKAVGLRALARQLGDPQCAFAFGDSLSDLTMLGRAKLAAAPRNADSRLRQAGIRITKGAYQAGLLEACSGLLGHRPGRCPVCRTPRLSRRSRALLAVLALPEGGIAGLPRRTLGLMFVVATGRL
jgi:hydroxymethylpyrimidine pyrophosphatase-like HAD family hydrolase